MSDQLDRLALNQRTCAEWSLREAIDGTVAAGLTTIGLWREPVAEVGLDVAATWIKESGLSVSSLCRGGFFTSNEAEVRQAAYVSNTAAVDECVALGTPVLVLVPGGLPAGDRDLVAARQRVADAIARLAPYAAERQITLAIEPMNPIYAADRGVVSTFAQAMELAEPYDPAVVGVVADTFHLWWEPGILDQLADAGDRIVSYQMSDWITPLPADSLLARGMMGDGHIDFAAFTQAVSASGYNGPVEVEIFNADIWAAPGDETLATIKSRYLELVEPYLT